jgi:hypothetical protein
VTLILSILFILTAYFVFYVLYISKFDVKGRAFDEKTREPNDIEVYIKILNIDRKRVNYRHLLHVIYLTLSIDLGLTYFIFYEVAIKNIVLKFLFGFIVILLILWISILILRLYFERRGERND